MINKRLALIPLLFAACAAPAEQNASYEVTVSLSQDNILPPGSIECVMDWSTGTSPKKSSCTLKSDTTMQREGCSTKINVGGVFTCIVDFQNTYRGQEPYTEGGWSVDYVSAFDTGGNNRLTVYGSALAADGQDVTFTVGPDVGPSAVSIVMNGAPADTTWELYDANDALITSGTVATISNPIDVTGETGPFWVKWGWSESHFPYNAIDAASFPQSTNGVYASDSFGVDQLRK